MADFVFGVEGEPTPTGNEPVDYGGTYALNEEHAAEAVANLIELFRNGPRNRAFVSALADQAQLIEAAAWAVFNAFDLDTATGHRLDLLGRIVGEGRYDRNDTDYRAAIRVRQLINRSNGTLPEMLEIAEGLVPAAVIRMAENFPATLRIDFDSHGAIDWDLIVLLLRQAKAGGVRLNATTGFGAFSVGAADGSPAGGVIGAADGAPAGFVVGTGT